MKALLPSLLVLVLAAISGPGSTQEQTANIFFNDDREHRSRAAGSLFSAVGVLQRNIDGAWAGRGTATLVSRCHVLTAHHIAFNRGQAPGEPRSFTYGPAHGSERFGKRVRAFPVIWGGKKRHFHEDWALLRLDPCVGDDQGWWAPLALELEEVMDLPDGVMMAGYPGDRSLDGVSIDPSCRVLGRDDRLPSAWLHDCATRIGDSGGALFYLDDAGKPRLLAVVHAEGARRPGVLPTWSPRLSNYAVPVANFIERIRPYIDGLD